MYRPLLQIEVPANRIEECFEILKKCFPHGHVADFESERVADFLIEEEFFVAFSYMQERGSYLGTLYVEEEHLKETRKMYVALRERFSSIYIAAELELYWQSCERP